MIMGLIAAEAKTVKEDGREKEITTTEAKEEAAEAEEVAAEAVEEEEVAAGATVVADEIVVVRDRIQDRHQTKFIDFQAKSGIFTSPNSVTLFAIAFERWTTSWIC